MYRFIFFLHHTIIKSGLKIAFAKPRNSRRKPPQGYFMPYYNKKREGCQEEKRISLFFHNEDFLCKNVRFACYPKQNIL